MSDSGSGTAIQILQQAAQSLTGLYVHGAQLGVGLLGSLAKSGAGSKTYGTRARGGACTCEIPTPCWEPQPLGELTSHVCAGATATIRFVVTNCGTHTEKVQLVATYATGPVTIAPASLDLGPKQRGVIAASFTMPVGAAKGEEREIVLWLKGCRTWFLRWTVKAAPAGCDSCHEVDVNDCADNVHHWYDHFYCHRACGGGR